MSPAILQAKGVSVTIGAKPIVDACDLELAAGELVAVVGPNGAGKSTLMRAVSGLQKLSAGSVTWQGRELSELKHRKLARIRAFVPQRTRVPDGVRVREAVAIGRAPHLSPLRGPRRHDQDAIDRAMVRGGVHEMQDRFLNTLSGGELQRVSLAVALAQETPVLIADEPTAHLDLGATSLMAGLMRNLADEGLGVALVVHDLGLAAAVSDRVVVLSQGRTVANGPAADVLDPELLADVWHVDARLEASHAGHTALHVHWLGSNGARDEQPPRVDRA